MITSSDKFVYIRNTNKYFLMDKICPRNPITYDNLSNLTFATE